MAESQINMDDIRTVVIKTSGGNSSHVIGPFVPVDHIRHILALKYSDGVTLSGMYLSGPRSIIINDQWGTSNRIVDEQIMHSGAVIMWPPSPRPDFPIGHIKASGIASVVCSGLVSGAGLVVNVTMIYTDRPGGRV